MAGFPWMDAMINLVNRSVIVGTAAVEVIPWLGQVNLQYMRLWNVAAAGGPTIWLSRAGVASVGTAGSFPIPPGEYELWDTPDAIPINALSAVSTVDGVPLTIEIA
jgi:hypothetical protein